MTCGRLVRIASSRDSVVAPGFHPCTSRFRDEMLKNNTMRDVCRDEDEPSCYAWRQHWRAWSDSLRKYFMFVGFVHTTLLLISIKQVQFYGKKEKDQTMSTPLPPHPIHRRRPVTP